MAKQVKELKAKTPRTGRSVYVPAGHEYIIIKPGEHFYMIEPGGQWPREFVEVMEKREQTAYEKGIQDGNNTLQRNMRAFTPEETLQNVLSMIRQHNAKDQNQIVAVILDELGKAYSERIKALAQDAARIQELLSETEKAYSGFTNIRNGGFEKLNFS